MLFILSFGSLSHGSNSQPPGWSPVILARCHSRHVLVKSRATLHWGVLCEHPINGVRQMWWRMTSENDCWWVLRHERHGHFHLDLLDVLPWGNRCHVVRTLMLTTETPVARKWGLLLTASTRLPAIWRSHLGRGSVRSWSSVQTTAVLGTHWLYPLKRP